jgi:hypothetical protein
LFAGFWVVKAQKTPCDQPAAARHRHGSLSSKPHLSVEGGGQPLVILSPASSAIEVRVIGRVLAALMGDPGPRWGHGRFRGSPTTTLPGWVATDMGGPGGRPVAQGAACVLWAVDLPDDGPTGGFYRDGRPVPW